MRKKALSNKALSNWVEWGWNESEKEDSELPNTIEEAIWSLMRVGQTSGDMEETIILPNGLRKTFHGKWQRKEQNKKNSMVIFLGSSNAIFWQIDINNFDQIKEMIQEVEALGVTKDVINSLFTFIKNQK